ncbi:MAG: S-layer homology domain-containing protein, partial [Clostridia bacterium]|nr:S-layer homology domain-containing protein [Clostridia bacterium]
IEEYGEHYIGEVNRPDFVTENLTVTLTATIAYQGQSAEKRFYLSVAEKDGNVSVVYEDFDSLSIDSTFTESVDGKIAHKNKNQITTIVPDPMDATNPVLKFEKTTDLPWVSSGSDATMNSSIPTLSRAGDFQMKFRLYIEKMSNLRFRITAPFVGEGLEEIDIFIESDGTFYQKNTGNKASKKLSIGQWNDVSIEFSTYSNTLDIYLNGELVLDNAPFSYSSGSTEVSAMKFKFVPPAGSSDGVATDTHTVYIDEMKILRMVDYSGEIAEAMEQLELQFLAAQNINAIAKDVVIPDLSQYAVTVSTSSSNPDVVANDGTVTRGNADTEINYTITLSNEYGGTRSRTFKLLVKNANYNSDDAGGTVDDAVAVLYDAKQAVENLEATYSLNYITGNLNLPKAGVNGSRLSWKSMNTDVLSDSGVVTRKDEDTEVTLFLTATLNGVSERIGIELIVKAAATSGNITGGGGGMATGSGANNISSFVSAEERTDAVKEETASSFVDVENHWAKAYIQKLYELKIVNGITETTFAPDLTITREAFVTMLMRMLGYEYSDQTLRFYDVDANEWYYPYVMAAYDAGIVYGISESEFGVGRNITRQDLCTMIARAIEMQGVETDSDERQAFKDAASIDDYAKEAVYSLRNLEIISGKGENCFDPRGEATRAETAKIIAGLVDIIAVTKGQE